MARDIFYDFFIGKKKPLRQPVTRKPFLVEPTRYKSEIVIPNWNPFKAISFLASKAVSASKMTQGANFVFYQTLQGFRFVSIETLMLGGFRLYKEKYADIANDLYDEGEDFIDCGFNDENEYWDSMLALKKITAADGRQVVTRRAWTSGTVYDM